ncbi:ferrochelatase, partial [bacterium]|nr:ferrochelatase [bacterium]MBU1676320.1 ferrochelatase [bacterium]
LGPDVPAETRRLAGAGCRRLHVQPVSFTCEHIETLHELDIALRADALAGGVIHFSRGAALNLDDTWLASLAAHLLHRAYREEAPAHA